MPDKEDPDIIPKEFQEPPPPEPHEPDYDHQYYEDADLAFGQLGPNPPAEPAEFLPPKAPGLNSRPSETREGAYTGDATVAGPLSGDRLKYTRPPGELDPHPSYEGDALHTGPLFGETPSPPEAQQLVGETAGVQQVPPDQPGGADTVVPLQIVDVPSSSAPAPTDRSPLEDVMSALAAPPATPKMPEQPGQPTGPQKLEDLPIPESPTGLATDGPQGAAPETGHYDDGHSWGWNKPAPEAQPTHPHDAVGGAGLFGRLPPLEYDIELNASGPSKSDQIQDLLARPRAMTGAGQSDPAPETGHYDDGHSWGWKAAGPVAVAPAGHGRFFTILSGLAVGAVVLTVVGTTAICGVLGPRTANIQSQATPPATLVIPTAADLRAVIATAAPTAQAAATNPCALVTTTEAAAILEKPVTATAAGTNQCGYKPQPAAGFRVAEGDTTAGFVITNVVITVFIGREAASKFDARQALYGRDPDDQQLTGLGDKAIVVRGGELAVLQGSSFISVVASGSVDRGSGRVRYQNTWEKYIGILEAFARTALTRVPR